MKFGIVAQALLNMSLYGVVSLILTIPHSVQTVQILVSEQEKQPNNTIIPWIMDVRSLDICFFDPHHTTLCSHLSVRSRKATE